MGAIGVNYTNFTMKGNAKITGNKGRLCGGVGMTRSQVKIEGDSVISNNDGGRAGGGILALSWPSNFPTTLSISGGHITGNEAPQGAGICVAGEKLRSDLLPLPPEYGGPQPCQLELSTGAEITGNTATKQGGGIWVGWEVSPKISGEIHVAGNTLEDGTANDIYLDRDPAAPPDPDEPEWGEEPDAPDEPEAPATGESPNEICDARMKVTAPLTDSQIGVFVAGARSGRVFAYADKENYKLTQADLDVFTVENPGYIGAGTVANTLVLKRPAVEIAPANMIIYMGGEDGYDAVVNPETGAIEASTSLPVLGFTVTLPNGVEADNLKLQYKNDNTVRRWTLQPYDGNESHNVYRIEPAPGSETNVRMVFTNSKGETITEDKFDVSKNLNQTLTVKAYGEGIEEGKVSILCGNEEYPIKTMEGTITVRGTTSNVSYADVVENPDQNYKPADPEKPDQVVPGATVPTGTVFAINGGEVHVGADAQVALLFDAIIDSNAGTESKNYTELLEEKAEDILTPAGNATRHTEFRYLDLVDQKNGNAWVAAQDASGNPQTVTVYWPLPEGTTKDTKFTLLHFEGLHRGMTPQEITDKLTAPDYTPETISDLRVTDTHVIFETTGFSPFALVWDSTKPGDDNNNNNNTTKNNVTVTDKADAPAPAAAAPSAAASGAAIPQTGDTLPVGLLGGVAAVAVAAFVVLLVLRKRKHDD